ncbi:UNVERIFIED_CONTAM: hypothetical protein PYX00_006581 [Menopon gallinae]|uniref:Transmembrane protein 164 n=1 Tax=Menopon gallinae TaxID=328185 RepID=A0AAW2HXN9_9NEOP
MMIEWAMSGVNTSSTSGGPVCRSFMSDTRRLTETVVAIILALVLIIWSYSNLTLPKNNQYIYKHQTGKTLLLVIFSVAFGVEIGFKFASKTVIYLLNPCHVMTLVQLYLLAATPSNTVTSMFRIHLNLLNGPILAFLFPETDNRRLPFEKWIYWIQHSLLIIVPTYLLRQGGIYNVEPLDDMSWVTFSYGLNILYHYLLLQPLALPTEVNLNHMLCPAEMDPFSGPYYRVFATIHQGILCPLACKIACKYLSTSINNERTELVSVKSGKVLKVNGLSGYKEKIK